MTRIKKPWERNIPTESTDLERHKNKAGTLIAAARKEHHCPLHGVNIGTTPVALAAAQVFTPEELEARIAAYRERAQKGKPLFAKG